MDLGRSRRERARSINTSSGTPRALSASTTADSPWRMKPWSTCKQISRSEPIALFSSAAHTEESTPPETRHSTWSGSGSGSGSGQGQAWVFNSPQTEAQHPSLVGGLRCSRWRAAPRRRRVLPSEAAHAVQEVAQHACPSTERSTSVELHTMLQLWRTQCQRRCRPGKR